jgi:hypothetical protein
MKRFPGNLRGRRGAVAAFAALAVLALPTMGCGAAAEKEAYETVTNGVLEAGSPIARPQQSILALDGAVTATNDKGRLLVDLELIEQLGLIRYSVNDPWLKREVTYTGILLSDLARLAEPRAGAKTMHFVALDDYEVDITLEEAERWPIMLATRLDGHRMDIANGGPSRIVFPYGLVSGIDELHYKDLWIWNIERITFS